jgi:cell division protein FtsL
MILRLLNLIVIGALMLAAAYVYRIKYDATVQAERLARLRGEVRQERDKIAALRAEWERLDNPERIEALAKRFLQLQPIAPTQFDTLDRLPERPPQDVAARTDPIGGMIDELDKPNTVGTTGSIPATAPANRIGQAPAAAGNETHGAAIGGSR